MTTRNGRIGRLVAAAAAVLFAAAADPASAQTPGHSLSLTGPSSATVGQPVILQATGANPPDDFFASWLDVHAIPTSVLATCPDVYLNASQVASSTSAQGGEAIAIAQRENVDAAGRFSMPLGFSPRVPGQFIICAYTNDGATWTHTYTSMPITVNAPSGGGGDGGGTTPPAEGGDPAAPAISVAVTRSYTVLGRYTRFRSLKLRGVPAGAKVVVTCRYKGRRCAGKARRTFRVRNASGTVEVKTLRRARLKAGSRVTIKVSKPGAATAVQVIRIRKNAAPRVT